MKRDHEKEVINLGIQHRKNVKEIQDKMANETNAGLKSQEMIQELKDQIYKLQLDAKDS